LVALEHSTQTSLSAADRPNLYNDDLTPYGGPAVSNVSFPGNVQIGTNVYAIPAGQNGQGFTLAKLGVAGSPNRQSIWRGVDALPRQRRDTALIKYDWQLTDTLKFFGYGVYTDRKASASLAAPSSTYTVPSTNPFSPCAVGVVRTNAVGAACPANGNVSVIHSWFGELGNARRNATEKAMDFTNGFELELPGKWKATLAGTYGESRNTQSATTVSTNAINVLLTAPGAVVNVNVPALGVVAVTHPTNIPSLNLFCGTPSCNDPASLAYISTANGNEARSVRKDVTLNADGPLFTLPGGSVRLAVGAEYIHDYTFNNLSNFTVVATVSSAPITLPTSKAREVKSVFSELYVPLVGADNAKAGVQKLDLSLAARYDHYSDFGGTLNPKFGLNWMPTESLTLRASYGTSFRAPTLAESNPLSAANIVNERSVLGSTLTGASNIVAGSNYTALTTGGGRAGLNPETAKTFSLGFEFKPPTVRGLQLSVNYYNLTYKNRIETPANSAGFPANLNASPLYDSFFIYNPTFYPTRSTVTQAQFNALLAAKIASPGPVLANPPPASTGILALIDGTRANSGSLKTSGFDLAARYSWGSGQSRWNIGATATYVLNYDYSPVPGAATLDYTNVFSSIGSPLRLRGRGQIGWSGYGFSTTAFVNYQNAYNFPNGVNFPVNLLPAGVVAGTYGKIAANTTFDAALSYDTKDAGSILKNIVFRVYVVNFLDRKPPFALNGTVAYDPTQASQVGRTFSLQITKRW
jgi:iron complex outermembrane recepter protein